MRQKSRYGGDLEELYQPRKLNEQVDQVEGIEPEEYAKIGKSSS